jgi:hypothetical protein
MLGAKSLDNTALASIEKAKLIGLNPVKEIKDLTKPLIN